MGDKDDSSVKSVKQIESYSQNDNMKYKEKKYWENRFQAEEEYEWLCTFNDVREYINRDIDFEEKILILGCGNSTFSADLCDAGYQHVNSADFSSVVIDAMRKKYASSHPSLKWFVSDVRDLKEFEDSTFDVVIDKACIDALVCDEGDPWNPNEQTKNDVNATLNSTVRVLKSHKASKFISIGFQQPHFRKRYLTPQQDKYGWEQDIETFEIDVGMGYFYTRCKLSSGI